ncbi:hypothetical protein Ae201684P_001538 [Aphanomyces euteiches]|uniref:Uncharacterized protein n=1 Tax=Aphanomyces euteiches TaxID=100861 RepID=A0A6G0W3H2_9STRA|nr:hypothetical protein Ae201684_019122 [Aphanomyces euteiches]KAH9089338.1 hypothetical protein Ae201684P_001538 [Aphanomyces euteiches]
MVATAVSSELRESFMINGVAPVTLRDIDSRLENFRVSMIEVLRKDSAEPALSDVSHENLQVKWKTWSANDGQICHFVPPGWEFPARIRPYKLLSQQHDVNPKHQMRNRRVFSVMCELESIARDSKFIPKRCQIHKLHVAGADELFQRCFPILLAKLYSRGSQQRCEEIACSTVYNRLCIFHKSVSS